MRQVTYKGKEYKSIREFADTLSIPYQKAYEMVWQEKLTKTGGYKPASVDKEQHKSSSFTRAEKEPEPFSCPDGGYPSREYLRYAQRERQRLLDTIPMLKGWDAVKANREVEYLEDAIRRINAEGNWFMVLDLLSCGEDVSYMSPNVVHTSEIILQNPKGLYKEIYGGTK